MQPILLTSFTVQTIINNKFFDTMPEFYQLRDVMESQGWHDNQTVFDHSLESARALESITRFDYLGADVRNTLTLYLAQTVETHARGELLLLATLLHDIGKIISLQHNAQGNTSSPSHGILGAWVARPLVERFDISDNEKEIVLGLIADHLVPSDLIEMSINNQTDSSQIVELLQVNRPNATIELLLLGYADWMGCDIREPVRAERDKRVEVVHDCLARMAGRLS